MNKKQWVKASPRARQKAIAQKDMGRKIVKARQLEAELDKELLRHINDGN